MKSSLRQALVLAFLVTAPSLSAEDWPRFRGPNGDGTTAITNLPLEWGPEKNVAWRKNRMSICVRPFAVSARVPCATNSAWESLW